MLTEKHPARLAFLISLIFGAVALFTALNHELWLDETEPWLLARDSHSFGDLLNNKRYEGHPDLWYAILFIVTSVTTNVVALQIIHVAIATATVYLIVRYAPFSFLTRILFCFGYFFVYEYAAISRLYAVEMLLTVVVCIVYPKRHSNWLLFWLVLFLLAQSNFFGMLLSAAIAGLAVLEIAFEQKARENFKQRKYVFISGLIVFIGGLYWSMQSMIPPADCYYAAGWFTDWDAQRAANTVSFIWNCFVPIPEFHVKDWNSNIISSVMLKAILAAAIYGITLFSLRKKPLILLTYFGVTIIMLMFFYSKLQGSSIRHQGHFFTVYIFFLWIYHSAYSSFSAVQPRKKWTSLALPLLLSVHLLVGGYAVIKELIYPFSENKMVADFIKSLPAEVSVVTFDDLNSSPLSAYLDRPIYYPARKMFGSYYQLTEKGRSAISSDIVLSEAHQIAVAKKQEVIVVFDDKDQLIYMPTTFPVELVFETKDEGVIGPPYYVFRVLPDSSYLKK